MNIEGIQTKHIRLKLFVQRGMVKILNFKSAPTVQVFFRCVQIF